MAANEVTVGELNRRLAAIERLAPAAMNQRIIDHAADMVELRAEMRSVRRALYTMGASVLASAILFAVTIFASGFGHA